MSYSKLLFKHRIALPTLSSTEPWRYKIPVRYKVDPNHAAGIVAYAGVIGMTSLEMKYESVGWNWTAHFNIKLLYSDTTIHTVVIDPVDQDNLASIAQKDSMLEVSIVIGGIPGQHLEFSSAHVDTRNGIARLMSVTPKEEIRVHLNALPIFDALPDTQFFDPEKDKTLPETNSKIDKLLNTFGFLENDKREMARKAGVQPPAFYETVVDGVKIQGAVVVYHTESNSSGVLEIMRNKQVKFDEFAKVFEEFLRDKSQGDKQ